jgi:DNA-binding response OmpR family regulator
MVLLAFLCGCPATVGKTGLRARRPQLQVLFVSGHPGEMLKLHGLAAHSEFMQKPYDSDALAAVLARMISESSASPASSSRIESP